MLLYLSCVTVAHSGMNSGNMHIIMPPETSEQYLENFWQPTRTNDVPGGEVYTNVRIVFLVRNPSCSQ
jgi:hypothetical protein